MVDDWINISADITKKKKKNSEFIPSQLKAVVNYYY